jgi:hypothetical protein
MIKISLYFNFYEESNDKQVNNLMLNMEWEIMIIVVKVPFKFLCLFKNVKIIQKRILVFFDEISILKFFRD